MIQGSRAFLTARHNKTAYRKSRLDINNSNYHSLDANATNQFRPFTTSLGRTQQIISFRKYEDAEEDVKRSFQGNCSNYIQKKFKILAEKYKQTIVSEESMTNSMNSTMRTISNPEAAKKLKKNRPKNVMLMQVCGLSYGSPIKVQNAVGEPYLVNTKQKLARIITKKKQVEQDYKNIQLRIRQKQEKTQRLKKEKQKNFRNPQHVKTIEWDSEWVKGKETEQKRYRFRLESKHKRQNSMLIKY